MKMFGLVSHEPEKKLLTTINQWSGYKIPTDSIYYGTVVLDCARLPDEMVPQCVWHLAWNVRTGVGGC